MKNIKLFIILSFFTGLIIIMSCKPINLFSPLVNPDKMGNDAKLDAGNNALADGDYDEAIDYFSDVIENSSGDDLTDAYLGRASAYMNSAAPNLGEVVSDIMGGELEVNSTADVINSIIEDDEYDTFFDNIQNAADDYNSAIDNSGSDIGQGILFEAYQTNMMAATGVGAQAIAVEYNTSPWGISDVTLNEELDAILDDESTHPFNMSTWDNTTPSTNGLRMYVNDTSAETEMLGYLTNAFNALTAMESDPPMDMDTENLKSNINSWVTNGLNEAPLT